MQAKAITRHVWHVFDDGGQLLGQVRRFVGTTVTWFSACRVDSGELRPRYEPEQHATLDAALAALAPRDRAVDRFAALEVD